jgi:acyl carrier protein
MDAQIGTLEMLEPGLDSVRDYRSEPDEVTAALNQHEEVQESHVIAKAEPGKEGRLIAYVVPGPWNSPSEDELRAHLRIHLPEFMIPDEFVLLFELPLTAEGEVDRSALPPPSPSNGLRKPLPPRETSIVEARLTKILCRLLELPEVGVDENFFMIEGRSMRGSQLLASIEDTFGVRLTPNTLFEAPTVSDLASEVERVLGSTV